MTTHTTGQEQRILTIPNLLSLLRLAMIPGIVLLYQNGRSLLCAALLAASALTDLLDGWIARHCNAISDVGKVLDPIADKLTLAAALWMLATAHPALIFPLALLLVKELIMGISGMLAILRTGEVHGAQWHGKAATALTYLTMFVHLLWQDIPSAASNTMAAVCTCTMLLSLLFYTAANIRRIQSGRGGSRNAV